MRPVIYKEDLDNQYQFEAWGVIHDGHHAATAMVISCIQTGEIKNVDFEDVKFIPETNENLLNGCIA